MLLVLFIVMAIAVISSGFIARSDAELQSGRNFCLRNEADYLAWAGLEHARALVISPDNEETLQTWSGVGLQINPSTSQYYDLTINTPVEAAAKDPNALSTYTYSIQSSAYIQKGGAVKARSVLNAALFFDPNEAQAHYLSVRRD